MRFNALVPELTVSNLQGSLLFYCGVLGFKKEYERAGFAFLSFQGAQIMLEQKKSRRHSPWSAGVLRAPYGRGINFQFEVQSLAPILRSLKTNAVSLRMEPTVAEYRVKNTVYRCREILVMDPDGYLLRFSEDL